MARIHWRAASVGLLLCLLSSVRGATVPDGFREQTVVGGLSFPTDFCFFPGDSNRFIVLEQSGTVKLVVRGGVRTKPFMDIRDRVNVYRDRGLLSCTIDTSFASNRFVYFAYVYEDGGNERGPKTGQVIRRTSDAARSTAPESSELILLGTKVGAGCRGFDVGDDVICCDSPTHAVGGLDMDAKGRLWVSIGDGADVARQDARALETFDSNSLRGKLLRVSRTGQGLADNPFRNGAPLGANRAKVWSLGARNAWRIRLDPVLGVPWLSDVGWNKFEEINLGRRGANWEWPCRHGPEVHPLYANFRTCRDLERGSSAGKRAPPLWYYPRRDGTATSGTLRVDLPSWPREFRGWIYHTDFSGNWMKRFRVDRQGRRIEGPVDFISDLPAPVQTRIGPDKQMYVLLIGSGQLRRYVYVGSDGAPPKIRSFLPRDGGRNVDVDETVRVTFTKAIVASNLARHFRLRVRAAGTTSPVPGRWSYNAGAYIVSFVPAAGTLAFGSTYEVEVTGVRGRVGGGVAAQSATFRTVPEDSPEPQVVRVEPGDGASGVGVGAKVVLRFNRAMDRNSLIAAIRLRSGGTNLGFKPAVSANAQRVELALERLPYGRSVDVIVGTNIADATGTSLRRTFRSSFRTEKAPPAATQVVYLDSLEVTAAERRGDYSLSPSGPVTIVGPRRRLRTFKRGISMQASKKISFRVPQKVRGTCSRFVAEVGLAPKAGRKASVDFAFLVPGARACRAGPIDAGDAGQKLACDVRGASEVSIVARDRRDGNEDDFTTWGAPRLLCGNRPPRCEIDVSENDFRVGDKIVFRGQARGAADNLLGTSALSWTVLLHHCAPNCHEHRLFSVSGVAGDSFRIPNHGDYFYHQIICTACDGSACASNSVNIYPETALLTAASVPTGLELSLENLAGKAPLAREVVVGANVALSAVANQGGLRFASWSHNARAGPTTSVKITSSRPRTFTATFR